MRTIQKITVEKNHKLRLTYTNGEVIVADFKPLIEQGGMYAALSDPMYFSQAAIGERGRYVQWPGELDFCADALCLEFEALASVSQERDRKGKREVATPPDYVIQARRTHPRAYEKWTPEEEDRLLRLVKSGKRVSEIAAILQRQPDAVQSRLEKLNFAVNHALKEQ